jgi:ribonuclease Z
MQLTLAMHSSPRFSTWIWIPDWHLLVDAGDGATQHLGYKIRKIDTVAMTHAHRDHCGGLLQVINQRGEAGGFTLAHPVGGKSWKMLENFAGKFNPGTSWNAVWRPLEEGDLIETGVDGRLIKAFRSKHYSDDDGLSAPRSLGYHCLWRKQKVRPEYRDLPQAELDALRLQLGREGITSPVDEKHISISGDGCPVSPAEVEGSQLLLHEATFLHPDDYDAEEAGEDVGHVHSTLWQAVEVAHQAQVPNLVLYHISTRYTDQEIRDAVKSTAEAIAFPGKIWAAFPRRVYWDLLNDKPLWSG